MGSVTGKGLVSRPPKVPLCQERRPTEGGGCLWQTETTPTQDPNWVHQSSEGDTSPYTTSSSRLFLPLPATTCRRYGVRKLKLASRPPGMGHYVYFLTLSSQSRTSLWVSLLTPVAQRTHTDPG